MTPEADIRRVEIPQCNGTGVRRAILRVEDRRSRGAPFGFRTIQDWPKDLPTGLRQAEREEDRPQGFLSPAGDCDTHPLKAGGEEIPMLNMRRRDFVALLGGVAAAWPLAARAQQPAMPVVGFLRTTLTDVPHYVTAFRQGLKEAGFVEGQNVAVEYRSAEGRHDRLPALVADLVRRPVAVIVATTTPAALAAKAATTTIPIVFEMGSDPVRLGLVASLNRPGGNVTGVSWLSELAAKQLGLLRDLAPGAARIAVLVDPKFPTTERFVSEVWAAASAMGQQIEVLDISSDREIETTFTTLAQR
ncbi:MAG: ABC transporter substrate-binding protein, partial [Xanthobacteraceae bacterium]